MKTTQSQNYLFYLEINLIECILDSEENILKTNLCGGKLRVILETKTLREKTILSLNLSSCINYYPKLQFHLIYLKLG